MSATNNMILLGLAIGIVGIFLLIFSRVAKAPKSEGTRRASDRKRLGGAERAAYSQAKRFAAEGNPRAAADILDRIGQHRPAIAILEKAGCYSDAAEILLRMGHANRAGALLQRNKLWAEAAACFRKASMLAEADACMEQLAKNSKPAKTAEAAESKSGEKPLVAQAPPASSEAALAPDAASLASQTVPPPAAASVASQAPILIDLDHQGPETMVGTQSTSILPLKHMDQTQAATRTKIMETEIFNIFSQQRTSGTESTALLSLAEMALPHAERGRQKPDLAALADKCSKVKYEAAAGIELELGQEIYRLHFVLSGQVDVFKKTETGEKVKVDEIRAGGIFGLHGQQAPRRYIYQAAVPTELAVVSDKGSLLEYLF